MMICSLLAAAVLFAGDPPARREMLPHPSVFRMANQARAIVEGQANGKGVVTITKRWLVQPGDQIGATIAVPSLVSMSKMPGPLARIAGAVPIQPVAVLLFLQDNPKGNTWVPMHLIGKAARGVIWETKAAPWGYTQTMNPGPYSLRQWQFFEGERQVEATMNRVRTLVAAGVTARGKWQQTLAIGDPIQRANALANWFSPETSPDGKWWRERVWPDLQKASADLGEVMVKPLTRIVKASTSPHAVATAADALGRLGPRARDGAPALIARLRDLSGAEPIFLVRALRRLADPRAQDVLRDLVAHKDLPVAMEAAIALHASGGDGAVEMLVERMPAVIDARHQLGVVSQMLEFVHDHQPELAEKLVVNRYLDCRQLMMRRPWLRRIRDRE